MSIPIPQPQERFLIGNLNELDSDFPLGSFLRLQKLYGDIYCLNILGCRTIIICSQELVNFVCDQSKFDKALSRPIEEIRSVAGDGLFTARTSEPNWKLAHNILVPAFGPQAIRSMFPQMMDIASQLILRWHRFAEEEIDVCDNFTRLTLDTIALCGFDYRFNSFYRNEMHPFVGAMANVLAEGARRSQRLPLQNTLMLRSTKQYQDDIAYIHKLCDDIVQYRRKHPNDTNDLLNRMINGKDEETGLQLSDENIRYQMVTFLIAGHETTSGLLSFAFYYLLKNPQAFQKAQAEADQFDEITDDRISVLVRQLHRDPKVWDRPEDFLPERMLDGGFENLPPNAWKPFGNGQRGCIGRSFAIQESVIVTALILKHFNLEFVDPSYDLRIKQVGTIKPAGFKIRARPRQQVKIPLSISVKKQEETAPVQTQSAETNRFQPLSILFGSNSGSCESFARTLASEAPTHGFNATLATLDSVVGSIPCDRPVIIVTSSYEGEPCNNAKQFVAYLESKPELKINYAVFGAGHHDWVNTYQKIPIYIDETLEKVGGTRIVNRGIGDVAGDFFGAFEAWKENLFQVLCKMNGLQAVISQEKLSIEIVNSTRNLGQITDVGIVTENKLLVEASELGPAKRHIEIELPKGQTYRAGDYLAILPTNPSEVVHQVLKLLYQLTENQLKQIQVKLIPHLVYLSIPSDNTSYDIPRLIQKIFSPELFSLRHVNLGYLYVSQFQWSQSHSLHSISVCCTSSVMVLHILASSPNLSTLHAHFEKNNFNIFHEIPSITNHPLKYFTLSDPYSVLCFKHIDTFLLYMPYVQRIKLNFNCDVPFIRFAQTVSNRLLYLRRFDCHIDNAPDDEITSDETIRQIHPCFNCIQCTIDDYGYRTYTTD
ncbi:unnamed protein product [Rotaria sp. Silwood1]|nr:unnamed protein product [Rotaria sp. Silwood1]